jgi:putative phosphoesterase
MRVAVISDTHLPRGTRRLPDACVERLRAADAILHAGDLMTIAVLEELEAFGPPVHAVHGNADDAAVRERLPHDLVVDLDGARIGMVHNGGPAAGRLERLHARFPDCAAAIFGHSHMPLHETSPDASFQIFNPGSPTDRRREPFHTMGELLITSGEPTFTLIRL